MKLVKLDLFMSFLGNLRMLKQFYVISLVLAVIQNVFAGLGTLLYITLTDSNQVFLGGLDPRDDGQFHYLYQDNLCKFQLLCCPVLNRILSLTRCGEESRSSRFAALHNRWPEPCIYN